MSRRERQKGARGERDLRDLFRAHGFDARRDGRLNADLVHDVPGVHVECKRCETLLVPKWLRQVVADAGQLVPALFFRRSHEPWWVIVPADHYLALQRRARDAHGQIQDAYEDGVGDALTDRAQFAVRKSGNDA